MKNKKSVLEQAKEMIVFEQSEITISKLQSLKQELFDLFSKYMKIDAKNLELNVKMLWSTSLVFMVDCVAENIVFRSDKL